MFLEGCDDLLLGTTSPGFNYDPKSSLGPQVLAKNATAPSHAFGCANGRTLAPSAPSLSRLAVMQHT